MSEMGESVFETLKIMEEGWPEASAQLLPEVLMFFKIEEQLERTLSKEAEKNGVQLGDVKVLFRLRVEGPEKMLKPTTLYTNLGLTSGGLTKILNR